MTRTKEEIRASLEKPRPTRVFSYIHGNGRIGVLLHIEAQTDFCLRTDELEQFAHEVCLQIASMNPCAVDAYDCEARALAHNSIDDEVAAEKPGLKPEIHDKIVKGKMAKWEKDNLLLSMPWVKDNSKTIRQMCDELSEYVCEAVTIVEFARFGS